MSVVSSEPLWRRFRRIQSDPADAVLRRFGIVDAPVPVERIARGLGVHVELSYQTGFAGESITDSRRAVIRVNGLDARVRQRFTMAHELGHVLLHDTGRHFRDAEFMPSTHEEVEANAFAADLLMPPWMVWPALSAIGYDPKQLANVFDVSVASMEYRLRQLTQRKGR